MINQEKLLSLVNAAVMEAMAGRITPTGKLPWEIRAMLEELQ